MKRAIYANDTAEQPLDKGWQLLLSPAGAFELPPSLAERGTSFAARVPGTVAEALQDAGAFDPSKPSHLHDQDAWYFLQLEQAHEGKAKLRFEGLATIADIFLNGTLIHQVPSMFIEALVDVELTGHDELAICFRALEPLLNAPRKRARWRSAMMSNQGLRYLRSTAFGYMPGWCPEVHAVGPYRPITLITELEPLAFNLSIRTELGSSGEGIVFLEGQFEPAVEQAFLTCAGQSAPVDIDESGFGAARLHLDNAQPWWPNSHVEAKLYEISLQVDGKSHKLGRTGFRRVETQQGRDGKGFGLIVNGEKIFCRGAVWSTADLVGLKSDRSTLEPILRQAAEAGMNMLRIAGTGVYEAAEFFELCDELGIMVWQDLMLANFDYPSHDEAFMALLSEEIDQLVKRHRHNPSHVVLCGGSEMQQQAAMFGLPPERRMMPELEDILTKSVKSLRPDLIAVQNSPCGGTLPFFPKSGVAHYFGVGAYRQPLSDARRANVSFASESLALSHIPEAHALPICDLNSEEWMSLIPSDRGADWNFEDIRDHYTVLFYDIDVKALRQSHPEGYLKFARATSVELVTELYSEFRRQGSPCNGALMLMLQDLHPSCGWGLLDASGHPKSPYFASKRIFQPIGLSLTDEATNGLDIHFWNETAEEKNCRIELSCLKDGKTRVLSAQRDITLLPRSLMKVNACEIIGAFFDVNYAYRFGPASHEVTHVQLFDAINNELLAEAFHYPLGRQAALFDSGLKVEIVGDAQILIEATFSAQNVHIVSPGYIACDNYFHMNAGQKRHISFKAVAPDGLKLQGNVTHLASSNVTYF